MLLEAFAEIWILIALGKLISTTGLLSREDGKKLNLLVIYVLLPILTFRVLYQADLKGLFLLPALGMAGFFIILGISFIIGRSLKLPPKIMGGFVLTSTIPNTGYLGYPLMLALFGEEGLAAAILVNVAFMLFTPTAGNYIATCYGGTCPTKKALLKEVILYPLFLAFVAGALFNLLAIPIPNFLLSVITSVGDTTIPLILIAIGVLLRLEPPKHLKELALIGASRFLIAPIVGLALVYFFPVSPLFKAVLVLELSMPPAIANIALAVDRKLDLDFTEEAIFVLTLVSMVTIPIIAALL